MEFNTILVIAIGVIVVLMIVARRLLRFAFRLVLAGLLLLAIVIAITVGWWQGWFGHQSSREPRSSQTRRTSH